MMKWDDRLKEKAVRKILILLLILVLGLISTPIAWAASTYDPYEEQPQTWEVVGDALWLRPIGFLGTVVSASAYVVSLPLLKADKGAEKTMDTLVKDYQDFTFERPLGH
jgi:hypothetical protein